MKIVSLLPSATEIVYRLGLGDALEGVTYECDHPPEARAKPVVCTTALPVDEGLTARQMNDEVTAMVAAGESIYRLDGERIRAIGPDVILTQDLCRVCAVPTGDVEDALDTLGCRAEVVSLDPSTLDDVIASVGRVGEAIGAPERAAAVMAELRGRIAAVRSAVAGRPAPRTLALEWSDPPFSAGHWVPDMIEAAGGEPVLARAGERSRRLAWQDVAGERAEVVVFMPCGYDLAAATAEGRSALSDQPALAGARLVVAVNANAYFSRPGPRVADGAEALAWVLHPDVVPPPPSGAVAVLRARAGG